MIVLQALYYALPMYLANMAPVVMKWLPWMDNPVDGGKMYKGSRLFGAHKTWRGIIWGVVFGMLAIYLQRWLGANFAFFADLSLIDYSSQKAMYLGALMGLGALVGDLAKSFFKRRFNRKSGSPWIPFDQLDFIVGGLLFTAPLYWPGNLAALIIVIASPLLHVATNFTAYKIGMKDVPW